MKDYLGLAKEFQAKSRTTTTMMEQEATDQMGTTTTTPSKITIKWPPLSLGGLAAAESRRDRKLTARWVLAINTDQITPYAADQTFCLKLSHALIFL